jgi:hypothetical protein
MLLPDEDIRHGPLLRDFIQRILDLGSVLYIITDISNLSFPFHSEIKKFRGLTDLIQLQRIELGA